MAYATEADVGTFAQGADAWSNANADRLTWVPQKGVPKIYPDVPGHIAAAASEAHECLSIGAYRAAVQMARSVVEATAKESGHRNGTLASKIDGMAVAGLLRAHIADAAHEIRYLGNEMAHGDFTEDVPSEEAEEIVSLMSQVLYEVFQSPAEVERRRAARLAKKAQQETQAVEVGKQE